jgi:hypothetical protein
VSELKRKRPEDLDHYEYIQGMLELMADLVASDSRYSIERQEYVAALANRFKRELREALTVEHAAASRH